MSDSVRATLASVASLLRCLPLFCCATPGTPLRVLCVAALDTLHRLRQARPLPRRRISELAAFLDFQACTNAAWDHKPLCETEYAAIRQRLEATGLTVWTEEYLDRLRKLERRRPSIGGDDRRFDEVRVYREAVVRLSLATVVGIALNARSLDEAIRATDCDSEVNTLFRIAMQCQIIDDVLDYTEDVSAALPSFLTATASLPQAIELTDKSSRAYASDRSSGSNTVWPLRNALIAVTAATTLVVRVACRRRRRYALADVEETC